MNHTDFANKIILRKKEESFNSYAEKLQHERDSMSSHRKIEKDAISRARSGTRSLTSLFGVKSQLGKCFTESKVSQRYYQEENQRPRVEKLMIRYESEDPYKAHYEEPPTHSVMQKSSPARVAVAIDSLSELTAHAKLVQTLQNERKKRQKQEYI